MIYPLHVLSKCYLITETEGTILTDPILVPGDMVLNLSFNLLTPSPDDLIIRTTTIRQNDNYRVPCIDGLNGSW